MAKSVPAALLGRECEIRTLIFLKIRVPVAKGKGLTRDSAREKMRPIPEDFWPALGPSTAVITNLEERRVWEERVTTRKICW